MKPGQLSASLSALFGELPMLERPSAAVALGFRLFESWWPWGDRLPAPNEADALVAVVESSGGSLALLNLPWGPAAFGGAGLAAIPEAEEEFASGADLTLALAERLRVPYLHVLAGNTAPSGTAAGIDTFVRRLVLLADRLAPLGCTAVIEPLNLIDRPDYFLTDPSLALDIVSAARANSISGNVALMADVYHLGASGIDPVAFIEHNLDRIGYVQIADAPGRGSPGSGALPIAAVMQLLDRSGWAAPVGLEWFPTSGQEPRVPSPHDLLRGLLHS